MPLLVLEQIKPFSTWLNDFVVAETPLGLSLRLRHLLSPGLPAGASYSGRGSLPGGGERLLLVRPHVGLLLTSLIATASPTGPQGRADGTTTTAAATAQHLTASGPSPSSPVASFAFFLQTLLNLSRSDGLHSRRPLADTSYSAFFLSVAAVDGVGRKVLLYSAMLAHAAEWWDTEKLQCSGGLHLASRAPEHAGQQQTWQSAAPFAFFEDSGVFHSRPLRLPSPYGGSDAVDLCRVRRRLLRVLRRLCTHDGWRLSLARPASSITGTHGGPRATNAGSGTPVDWMDYLVDCCIRDDLLPVSDYRAVDQFSLPPLCSPVETGRPPWMPPKGTPEVRALAPRQPCRNMEDAGSRAILSICDAMRSVLWHVLATEVEGQVLTTLHQLLWEYLCWPCFAHAPANGAPRGSGGDTEKHPDGFLFLVRQALCYLIRTPERAFACDLAHPPYHDPTAPAPPAVPPPVSGAVELSCTLPSGVCVLPLPLSADLPHFCLQGVAAEVSSIGSVLRRDPLRVLLLRVDPEGSWLPTAEERVNQRTYYTSFCEQGETLQASPRTARRFPLGHDAREDDGDDFALVEACTAGKRTIAHNHDPSPRSFDASPPRIPTSQKQSIPRPSDAEDLDVSTLTRYISRHGLFEKVIQASTGRDRYLWHASIRLYLYALLHGVRVILTPERMPRSVRLFGLRHVAQLHRHLCQARDAAKQSPERIRFPSTAPDAIDDIVSSDFFDLIDAVCREEPPLAIYVVDQVSLLSFTKLQVRLRPPRTVSSGLKAAQPSQLSSHASPCLAVVLCRDLLRHPSDAETGCTQVRVSGVGEVAGCGVFGATVLSGACAQLSLPHRSAEAVRALAFETVRCSKPSLEAQNCSFCTVFLSGGPLCDSSNSTSTATDSSGHATEKAQLTVDAPVELSSSPLIFLVAPTQLHSTFYGGLLRKAALSLLGALPAVTAPITQERCRTAPESGLGGRWGVVRGGGAFFVSLARQTRRLMRQLAGSSVSAAAMETAEASSRRPGSPSCAFTDENPNVLWGADVTVDDYATIRFVLGLVREACAAVATHLATPLFERAGAAGWAFPSQSCHVSPSPQTRGPLARRRLWMEALRVAVEAPSLPPRGPTLHVYHRSMEELSDQYISGTSIELSAKGPPTLPCSVDSYQLALRWFASGSFAAPSLLPFSLHANDKCEDREASARPHNTPPLFEPLHTNVEAVREALHLLLRTLCASIP